MNIEVRLKQLFARESQIAREGLNAEVDRELAAADEKKAKQQVIDLAEYLTRKGTLAQGDLEKLNHAATEAGCPIMGDFKQTGLIWLRCDDPSNEAVNKDKKVFDDFEKGIQRSIEEADDDKSVREIKLQEMNSNMMSADAALSDEIKQSSELDKKVRDNMFASPV